MNRSGKTDDALADAAKGAHPGKPVDLGRRRVLVSGAITVGFSLIPAAAMAQAAGPGKGKAAASAGTPASPPAPAPAKLPGSLNSTPMLDAWIRLEPTGRVTVCTGKAELGTGVRTAFIQIAAEQLDVVPSAITLITADTARTPNEGYTAGSHSLADSGTAILNAAAQVRDLLLQAAAVQLNVSRDTLRTENGQVLAADDRKLGYGAAIAGLDLHRAASPVSPLKDPRQFQVIGASMPRVDIPGKVAGGASYVQDMRLPGMLHARVVRQPSYGARLVSLDEAAVRALPGVVQVVRNGNYLAVVARDEWQAIVAMRALAAAARWEESASLPPADDIHAYLMRLPAREILVTDKRNGAAPAGRKLTARYTKPYLTHGSIGPSCALAQFIDGQLTVWTHTQGVFPLRGGLAEMLGLPPEQVRCIHVEGSGCYGHNGADDVAADAALIAHAVPGQPVRVQWMREQEHTWEPSGPAMITDVSATLDPEGKIVDWDYQVWSNSHNQRIDNAGRLMPTWALAQPFTPAPPKPIPMPEGGGDRNSIPLYDLPRMLVRHHFLPDMPLRVSAMRSLGAYMNIFTIESFMDELAQAAGTDPVQFRLRHLKEPRARAVVELAARQFGWPMTAPRAPGYGVGFAFAQYKNLMAYMALAVELEVQRETGAVRVHRVIAAVDCGQIVNPDGVRNQVEGGILQSFSWTLHEQLRFDQRRVNSYDWSTYPILRFSGVPARVEVSLIDQPGQPFLGAGEASQGPASAALANALANALGRRLHDTPLNAARLREGAA